MRNGAFQGILDFLKKKYGALTQTQIAAKLGLQQPQISTYAADPPRRASWWSARCEHIYNLGYEEGSQETAKTLMGGLVQAFGEVPQTELAEALGVTQPTISNWLNGVSLPTAHRFEQLLALHVVRLAEPLCEFYPIEPKRSGSSWKLHTNSKKEAKLRDCLRGYVGIYVFYDSAGRVTYMGKTESDLWTETKQRLKAKVNRSFYNPRKTPGVQQGIVARYLSAYEVRVPAAIHNLEVLMLRAFPNDLANTNIGAFKKGL